MKKLITAIAIGAFAFVGTTATSEARPYWERGLSSPSSTVYVSGYRHGQPVYTERYVVGHDRYGRPRFAYRTISSPRRHYTAPRHVAPCPPPRYSGHGHHGRHDRHGRTSYHGRSGSSVSFTFRR